LFLLFSELDFDFFQLIVQDLHFKGLFIVDLHNEVQLFLLKQGDPLLQVLDLGFVFSALFFTFFMELLDGILQRLYNKLKFVVRISWTIVLLRAPRRVLHGSDGFDRLLA